MHKLCLAVYMYIHYLSSRNASRYVCTSYHARMCVYVYVCCTFSLFCRYYAANTVTLPREVEQIWGCGGPLNGVCALHHYCTVTRLNPDSYKYVFRNTATPCNSTRVSVTTANFSFWYTRCDLATLFVRLVSCRRLRKIFRSNARAGPTDSDIENCIVAKMCSWYRQTCFMKKMQSFLSEENRALCNFPQ